MIEPISIFEGAVFAALAILAIAAVVRLVEILVSRFAGRRHYY